MVPVDLFGYIGGGMVAFSFLPQLLRVIKLKTANEISIVFTSTMFAGCLIWTAYAFYMHQLPMMIFSVINTSQTGLLVTLKYVYSKNQNKLNIDNLIVRNMDTLATIEDTEEPIEEEKQINIVLN